MRKLIIISLLFVSCTSQKDVKQLFGTWTCEYGTEIDLTQSESVEKIEVHDTAVVAEGEPMDTTYFPAMLVFEFMNNGKVDFLFYQQHEGNWYQEKDSIFISSDSSLFAPNGFRYKGVINEDKLYLETFQRNRKFVYCFEKREKTTATDYSQHGLIGTNWSYIESDSTLTSYHLIDTNEMILNDWHGMHTGRWGYRHFNGVGCLYVTSMYTMKSSLYYILDDRGNVEKFSQVFGYEIPQLSKGKLIQNDLLSNEEMNEIRSKLLGTWYSRNFKTLSRKFDDSVYYTNLYLKVEFSQSDFNLTYSGTKKSTNEEVITKFKGSWHLSETGDYIILKHTKKGRRDNEYEVREIVTLSSIYSDSLRIGLDYISLGERDCRIKDNNIKLNKGNGL